VVAGPGGLPMTSIGQTSSLVFKSLMDDLPCEVASFFFPTASSSSLIECRFGEVTAIAGSGGTSLSVCPGMCVDWQVEVSVVAGPGGLPMTSIGQTSSLVFKSLMDDLPCEVSFFAGPGTFVF